MIFCERDYDMGDPVDLGTRHVSRILLGTKKALFMALNEGRAKDFIKDNPTGFLRVAGDLWVRESWLRPFRSDLGIEYRADCGGRFTKKRDGARVWERLMWNEFSGVGPSYCGNIVVPKGVYFRSPTSMPKKYCRLVLHVVWVRVTRVQCLTENMYRDDGGPNGYECGLTRNIENSYRATFKRDWDKRYGKGSFAKNPYLMMFKFVPDEIQVDFAVNLTSYLLTLTS